MADLACEFEKQKQKIEEKHQSEVLYLQYFIKMWPQF